MILGKRSLKNILEIKATISGYANKIVHANPDGIYVKAPNKNTDDRENIIPNTNNINNSFKDILKDVCLNNLSHNPYIKTANKYL